MMDICSLPYSHLNVFPGKRGRAMLSTCITRMHARPHNVSCVQSIRAGWNSKQFQAERFISTRLNKSDCLMASSCMMRHETPLLDAVLAGSKNEEVQRARRERQSHLDYLPKTLTVAFSHVCMNACVHCLVKRKENKYELSGLFVDEICEHFIPSAEYIEITGGEPLYTHLSICQHVAYSFPDKKKRISTNGILLEKIDFSQVTDNTVFVVTLYGFSDESYSAVTETNNFQRVREAIHAIVSNGFGQKLYLKFVVTKKSVACIDAFCSYLVSEPSIRGASIVADTFGEQKMFSEMQVCQARYALYPERITFLYCGAPGQNFLKNAIYDQLYYFIWIKQLAKEGWFLRK